MATQKEIEPIVYLGTIIDAPTLSTIRIRHNHTLGVNSKGVIAFIEPSDSSDSYQFPVGFEDARIVQLNAKKTTFLFPGLIDTHTHAPQYPNTGIFGSSTLLSWLETYTFPLEASFSSVDQAKRVYTRVVNRSVANGTTCATYHATLHVPATQLLAQICFDKGQRALVGRVCMDMMSPDNYRDESAETAVAATKEVVKYCRDLDDSGNFVRAVVTPRFAPSCTEECMSALGKLSVEEDLWCQTHTSENKDECKQVKEKFPKFKDYISVYDGCQLLGRKTILAHAIHLSDGEMRLIKKKAAKVSHCPASNTALTSGAAKVKLLLEKDITVGLGTDMSGGYSPSILEMARQAMLVSRHVAMEHGDQHKLSTEEVLFLATMGGAQCVGLEDTIGSFEVGKDFDALLINLDSIDDIGETQEGSGQADCFEWESWPDRVAEWLWTGDDRNVCAVWVQGRCVHSTNRKGAITTEF